MIQCKHIPSRRTTEKHRSSSMGTNEFFLSLTGAKAEKDMLTDPTNVCIRMRNNREWWRRRMKWDGIKGMMPLWLSTNGIRMVAKANACHFIVKYLQNFRQDTRTSSTCSRWNTGTHSADQHSFNGPANNNDHTADMWTVVGLCWKRCRERKKTLIRAYNAYNRE